MNLSFCDFILVKYKTKIFINMITRRNFLETSAVVLAGLSLPSGCKAGKQDSAEKLFRISLNTSTIRTYNLSIEQLIEVCGAAGFDGIELWVSDIQKHLDGGGNLADLARKLKDNRLLLENIIGFAPWSSDDEEQRAKGLLQMQREMELTAQLGGKYIAAPVMGIKQLEREKLDEYALRYRQILEIGQSTGVIPLLEIWGPGVLCKLADAVHIALGAAHPDANLLLDFYHMYRGGNSFDSLHLLNVARLPFIHINDYPDSPPREQLKDSDRVYPGDGVCPFGAILPSLFRSGFRGAFSVELFNESYCKQPVEQMLAITLEKTKTLLTC
jgi:sugar phosphate isomerase/epimerase